jgi:hypothetical protein
MTTVLLTGAGGSAAANVRGALVGLKAVDVKDLLRTQRSGDRVI